MLSCLVQDQFVDQRGRGMLQSAAAIGSVLQLMDDRTQRYKKESCHGVPCRQSGTIWMLYVGWPASREARLSVLVWYDHTFACPWWCRQRHAAHFRDGRSYSRKAFKDGIAIVNSRADQSCDNCEGNVSGRRTTNWFYLSQRIHALTEDLVDVRWHREVTFHHHAEVSDGERLFQVDFADVERTVVYLVDAFRGSTLHELCLWRVDSKTIGWNP